MSVIAEQLSNDPLKYVVVVLSVPTHNLIQPKDEAGAVRAEVRRTFLLTEVSPGITTLDYVCSLDLKGFVPRVVTEVVATPGQMNGPLAMQAYFQQLRGLSECTAQDGVSVAHMLVDAAEACKEGKRQKKHTVWKFALRTSVLRSSGFPHLSEMLATVISRTQVTDPESACDLLSDSIADPASVTEEEATTMGAVFAGILDSEEKVSPAAAVDRLMQSFAAFEIMRSKHAWFVPMLTTIAQRLQGASVVDGVPKASKRNSILPGTFTHAHRFDGLVRGPR
jgi:hypothetical protein